MYVRRLIHHLACRAFFPETLIREKYTAFKELLEWDHVSHGLMARLERIYHDAKPEDFCTVSATYGELVHALSGMVQALITMAPFSYKSLPEILYRIDSQVRSHLGVGNTETSLPLVLALDEIPDGAEGLVGGKAANLSRIGRELQLPVPKGFVVTSSAFRYFLELNGIQSSIEAVLAGLDVESSVSLESASMELTQLILQASLPYDLEDAISGCCLRVIEGRPCAVRSSAVGEDAVISFAGQYRSVLNVSRENLGSAYKVVIASKYSPRALSYRIRHGLLDAETPMAVLITEMIKAEAGGVTYSRNPFAPDRDNVAVYSVWGLGELLVKGTVTPDVIQVSREETHGIIRKECAKKEFKAILSLKQGIEIASVAVHEQKCTSIDDESARQLAAWAVRLEAAFGAPQDVEWCKDGQGNLYLLQSRPLKVPETRSYAEEVCKPDVSNPVLLAGGEKASSGVGTGRVVKIFSTSDLKHIPKGSVLVAPTTSPMFAQVIDRLSAVVTDVGSVAGHFASVAREWGIPTLVNTQTATQILEPGEIVTVDADRGMVLAGAAEGLLAFSRDRMKPSTETPLRRRLRSILDFVSPLNLLDPSDPRFTESNCRTLHDILRFTHERAVAEMFSLGGKGKRKIRGARKLSCDIPIVLYVLDLGGGLCEDAARRKKIAVEHVASAPFKALWSGLTDLKEAWSSHILHFDWGDFDRMGMGGGIVSFDSQLLASFALVASDYLNANIRFGYHFAVVDALLREYSQDNYVSLSFEGGGAEFEGRRLRALFMAQVLESHGFEVHLEQDSIHAQVQRGSVQTLERVLGLIGRLLAFTPFLDMTLNDLSDVGRLVEVFSTKSLGDGSETKESYPGMILRPSHGDALQQKSAQLLYRPTWVTDQLAVGHAPMSFEELESIRRQGVDAIINLCAEYCDLHQIEKDCGFDVFYLPVADDHAPEMEEMEKALAWLDEAIYLGKKVLIHCRLGVGRTGTFLRSYFIRRGFGLEHAEERLKRIHSQPTSYSQWRLLRRYGRQEGRLTIREPSLEGERPVDLSLYFAEYERFREELERSVGHLPRRSGSLMDCAEDLACCRRFFCVQFIEAVYLRRRLLKDLSREERLAAVQRAIASDRLALGETPLDSESLIPVCSVGRKQTSEPSWPAEIVEYLCPLNIQGKCIAHDFRPIACRAHGIQAPGSEGEMEWGSLNTSAEKSFMATSLKDNVNEELYEMSKRLFFALNGTFLERKGLLFPITHVVSGKFIQDYFTLLTEVNKQCGSTYRIESNNVV
jgi:pyruvate,water dikinase